MSVVSLKQKTKLSTLTAPGDVDPGAMIPIATTTVGAGGSSSDIVFSNIPQTYEHLQIRGIYKRTGTEAQSGISLSLNADSTNGNYARHDLYGTGSAVATSNVTTGSNTLKALVYAGSSYQFGPTVIDILDYSNSNKYKIVRGFGGVDNNNAAATLVAVSSALWINTAAITSVTISFGGAVAEQYTSFALYGIKRAGA
jgi:hypothetical protein